MAFNSSNLFLIRKTFIDPYKCIYNNYFSDDSIETILSPGYFPPYLGFDSNAVIVNDCIKIISMTDNVIREYLITSVDPLVLSSVSAPGQTLFTDAQTSGAVYAVIPFYFYKNTANFRFISIPGPFEFTAIASGKIEFPTVNLSPDFLPPVTTTLSMVASYLSQPFNLNFTVNTKAPYLTLSNDFVPGQTISMKNLFSPY